MFLQYFNLSDQPFGATPDPRFLFETGSQLEALASLYTGFYGNRGFTVLTAEPGMGKTTLLFQFLDYVRNRAKTVFLFNTLCEAKDIPSLILQDLGVEPGASLAERHRQLNDVLVVEARAGRRVVLVIDEAQNLSTEALEAVRLLTNFETAQSKLMQIVLAGQPQLADNLTRPEIAQLLQRVSTMCRLVPFTLAETRAYVEHRMKVAGYTGRSLFTPGALRLIADASRGIPRIINTLCFNSLCLCRARNTRLVDDTVVEEVIRDLRLPGSGPLCAVAPREEQVPGATLFAGFSEVRASSGRTARYITAALSIACLCVIGVLGSGVWTRVHVPASVAAILSPIRPIASTRATEASTVTAPISAAVPENPTVIATSAVTEKTQPAPSAATKSYKARTPKSIRVAPGETLEAIAIRNLGNYDEAVLRKIQALNPRLKNPNHIESGRTIRLPGDADGKTSDASTRNKP